MEETVTISFSPLVAAVGGYLVGRHCWFSEVGFWVLSTPQPLPWASVLAPVVAPTQRQLGHAIYKKFFPKIWWFLSMLRAMARG